MSVTSYSSHNPTYLCWPTWKITVCAFITYTVVFLCVAHGVASIGKAILFLWFFCISCFFVLGLSILIGDESNHFIDVAEGILTFLIPKNYTDLYSVRKDLVSLNVFVACTRLYNPLCL